MAERFKAPVLKTGEAAMSPWVRIPLPPPYPADSPLWRDVSTDSTLQPDISDRSSRECHAPAMISQRRGQAHRKLFGR